MTLLFWLAILAFGLTLAANLEIAFGLKRMLHLSEIQPRQDGGLPGISIIIPACNEADTIEPALRSVLELDYPDLEIIVIDDRSTDGTGEVLARMQRKYPQLNFLKVTKLPNGWMGKAHALQHGAEKAAGEYFLFTDADIVMEKTTLRRAMHHMLQNRLDHLSLFFENIAAGGLLNSLFLDIGGGLLLLFKPWQAKDQKSSKFMGVGAFNLVRAEAYRAIGGHKSFAMHPIDDIMLGKRLKQNGFAQDCLLGDGFIQVRWYGTVKNLISGVMKNTFAIYDFSVPRVLIGCLLVLIMGILPVWGLVLATGVARLLFAATVITRLVSFAYGLRLAAVPFWQALWSLVTPYLNIYIAVKAAVITKRNNGITWRGTHYSLDDMKKGAGLFGFHVVGSGSGENPG